MVFSHSQSTEVCLLNICRIWWFSTFAEDSGYRMGDWKWKNISTST